MNRITKYAIICSLALSLTIYSQQPRTLTFEEAVKIALENNVNLNQQKNQLALNQIQKVSSIASLAPSVSLNANAVQFNGNSFNQQQGRAINGIRDNVSGSLNADMTLFNGLNLISNMKQASSLLDAQSYFVKRTTEDVINTVASQYLQVLLDVELLRIAKENYEAQTKQYEQVRESVVVGVRSPVEEFNLEAQMNAAELRMLQAEINLNNDKAILTSGLLLDPFEQYEVVKPSWNMESIQNDNRDVNSLYETAVKNRGDVQRAINNEIASKYGMRVGRSAMLPSLTAFFNYGSNYNFQHNVHDTIVAQDPSINRPFEKQFGLDNVAKSYGLQLNIPVFIGFQNRTIYYRQKMAYQNSQLTRKNTEVIAKTDVLRTHQNFIVTKKTFTVSQSQLNAAEQAFALETERYNLGVTNFVDYAQANRAYIQAQTDMAQAEYRLLFQKVLLEYATGTLQIETIEH